MYFDETKSEPKCGVNKSVVGRRFISPQLVSAKPVGMRLALALLSAMLLAVISPAHGQANPVRYSFANTPDGANPRYGTQPGISTAQRSMAALTTSARCLS